MNNEVKYQGIKFDENPKDWIISADSVLIIPENTNKIRHFYNQSEMRDSGNDYENTLWSCGLFGSLGCISDLTGYKFTREDILAIQKLAIDEYGLSVPGGMYMSRAVDCVRDYWNSKFPNQKLFTTRTTIGSSTYGEAIKKGHSTAVGYYTSPEYYKDSQDDGKIQGEDFKKQGGHLVRCNLSENLMIDDNYFGVKKYNTYENNKIYKLKVNGVFFPSAYLFLKYDTMGEYETQYKAKYGKGTIYSDIEGALKKFTVDREFFFFNLIGLERIKGK